MKQQIHYEPLGSTYTRIVHPSGLTLLLCPMPEYATSYALFATKYGSIDNLFRLNSDGAFERVPDGIAHYLEHKLFENEEGDAFASYAATGASANAYTSFDRTAYLFSTTDHFEKSLNILLDFATRPYFTEATVEKEREIIGQEIQMYVDDPYWQVFFNLLKALYVNHPVHVDIAGTIESIAQIDADTLYKCYNSFYNLKNMVLAVAGNFAIEEVLESCDRFLKPAPPFTTECATVEEPAEVANREITALLPVATPLFNIGYKLAPYSEGETLRKQVQYEMLCELLAGEFSPLYRKLYDAGLINTTFDTELFAGRGFLSLVFSGESRDPAAVYAELNRTIEEYQANGIGEAYFQLARHAVYGRYVQVYSRVSAMASVMMMAEFAGIEAFEPLEALKNTTCAELNALLQKTLKTAYSAISVVKGE